MRQAFRIEHETTGKGPFQSDTALCQALAKAADARSLPLPQNDGLALGNIPWFYVFGSPCLQTLRQWVLPDGRDAAMQTVQALQAEGFVLKEYLVDDDRHRMGHSKLQLALDAHSCEKEGLFERHSLEVLLAVS